MLRCISLLKIVCFYYFFMLFFNLSYASSGFVSLPKVKFNGNDFLSLQRGANFYFENCIGCHSIKYARYKNLAEGLRLITSDDKKEILSVFVQKNWTFNTVSLNSNILSNLRVSDSVKWFGKATPDLSLVTKFRGANWVYMYLKSFYYDSTKQWKMNNLVFPDVAMPNVLVNIQGLQEVVYKSDGITVDCLKITKTGSLSLESYDNFVYDLVNFLTYVGEPKKQERVHFGYIFLPCLVIFSIFSYYLKKDYWSDLKKEK